MLHEPMRAETDVLVIGSGAAGMYAAFEAARAGCDVLLADRSLIGRGGATVMAQMTVAVALGSETPDHWSHHYQDTLTSGRGLCNEALAQLLCEDGPECIRTMDEWGVGWARKNGRITQVVAPGHDRPRCTYVDFLKTGPAVSKTLRAVVNKTGGIRKAGDLCVIDLLRTGDEISGAMALHFGSGAPVTLSAKATILATGGLTRLYRRNSASANMGGDGYALALRAGASLVDMEFVQFFPIGHLAPRLVGMDPIMWDPFRYKLGGRLLNNRMEEFTQHYGVAEDGKYLITRDVGSYAILKEVDAWWRLSELPALSGSHLAGVIRSSDRPTCRQQYRSHKNASRGGAYRALSHGRHRSRRAHANRFTRFICRRRSGRRRKWCQPLVRECDHRGFGVRATCWPQRCRPCQTDAHPTGSRRKCRRDPGSYNCQCARPLSQHRRNGADASGHDARRRRRLAH